MSNQNENSQKKESCLYRFEEMLDSLERSINNISSIQVEQQKLVDLIEKTDEANEFAEFVESMKSQIEDLESQKTVLVIRRTHLTSVIEMSKSNPAMEMFLNSFCMAIGMFDNQ